MLTLADGKDRLEYTRTMPAGFNEGEGVLTIDPADWHNCTEDVNKGTFRMSHVGSDTVADTPLSTSGNAVTFGAGNIEGSIEVLRQLDEDGRPDPAKDTLFTDIGTKGVRVWFAHRVGRRATIPLQPGDTGWIYEFVTDAPQEPTERAGFIKNLIPLGAQGARRFAVGPAQG